MVLERNSIPTMVHYPIPLHKQQIFKNDIKLYNTEKLSKRIISLPIHPYLEKDNIIRICKEINSINDWFS